MPGGQVPFEAVRLIRCPRGSSVVVTSALYTLTDSVRLRSVFPDGITTFKGAIGTTAVSCCACLVGGHSTETGTARPRWVFPSLATSSMR
ncbi:hypothetical protein HRbin30_00150 [bacterium HR30]|nr:hypothetical protein HRbin30_00150 [bacterium HR30]